MKVHSSQRVRCARLHARTHAQILRHNLRRDPARFPEAVRCIFIDTRAHVSDVVFMSSTQSETSHSLQLGWMDGLMEGWIDGRMD